MPRETLTDYVVKTLIINEDNQGLVMVRADNDDNRPGETDLVGGGLDEHEMMSLDFKKAAAREIHEESGLIVAQRDLTLVFADTRMNRQNIDNLVRMLFVTHKFQGEVKLSDEHSSFTWCDLHNLSAIISHPVWSRAIDYALENGLT